MFDYWRMSEFVSEDKLPIYVNYFEPGTHPPLYFFDHDSSKMVFIISGEAEHVVMPGGNTQGANRCVKIKAGDVLVIHPGCTQAYNRTENLELYNLVYNRHKLALPLLDGYAFPLFYTFFPLKNKFSLEEMSHPALTLTAEEIAEIRPMLDKLLHNISDYQPGSFYESMGVFMRLTHTLGKMRMHDGKKMPHPKYRIGNALFLIEKDYFKPLTLDDMAQVTNMSRRNFCRHFRLMTGTSPLQYLLTFRVNRAAELLRHSDLSIAEIATVCGFCDGNYFSKQFQKIKHKTPGAVRSESQKFKFGRK